MAIVAIVLRIFRARIIGYWGEKNTATQLSFLGNKYKVYNDVLIPTKNGTSQIDHIVVSPYGIFVIETKNYKGWIFGSPNSYKWTQNIYGKKYELYNPIIQNIGHITALKRLIPGHDDKFISIIVFSMHASLKTNIDKEYNVIKSWELISKIRSYKKEVLLENDISEICSKIEQFRIIDKESKKEHVRRTKEESNRKKHSVQNGICPICGATIVRRTGKYGSFYGCSNYPKCKFTAKTLS
jgi:hypothetical protein